MSKELRPYQLEAVCAVEDAVNSGESRLLLVKATGTGKTRTGIAIIERLKYNRVLWLSDRKELISQSGLAFIENKFDKSLYDHVKKVGFLNYILESNVSHGGSGYRMGAIKAAIYEPNANVVMGSLQTVWRRLDKLDENHFDCIVCDEAHNFGSPSAQLILNHFKPKLLLGLSVGPDSFIELKSKHFKYGYSGSIEGAWALLEKIYQSQNIDEYEVLFLKDTYSRGWENGKFHWKPIKTFIRHLCTKKCKTILVGGDQLTLTNDHSIYIAKNSKNEVLLTESKSDKVNVGDVCLYDTGYENKGDETIDVIPILKKLNRKTKILVNVDLDGITHETFKEYGIGYRKKWEYHRGVYGSFLPFKKYLEMRHLLPEPYKIYYEGAKGMYILPKIKLSDLAYFIGFFYGDGWFSDKRIGFAVEDKLVPHICNVIESITCAKLHYSVKNAEGKSKEIKISNVLFTSILKHFIQDKKCYEKSIHPSFILNWKKEKRLELIYGLIDSDGSFSQRSGNKKRIHYTTTSFSLAQTISSLLRSVGVSASISYRQFKKGSGGVVNGRKIESKRQSYSVHWSYYSLIGDNSGHKGKRKSLNHHDWIFDEAPIKNIKETDVLPKYVYDFEMTGHPSFVANGVLVHNTATPHRTDGMLLGNIFDKIVYEYPILRGIKEGYLCELDGIRVKTNVSLDNVHTLAGDLNERELSNEVNTLARNNLVAKSYLEYAEGRQAIGYSVDVQHAIDLAEACLSYGINASAISSNEKLTGDRDAKIKAFTEGKIDVLFNCGILIAGFDHPNVGAILQACPTKSLTKYLQTCGRGTRLKDKEYVEKFGQNCLIIDFVDNTTKHNLVNAWELDRKLPPEERVFITSEDRDKLVEARRAKIEGKLTNKDERIQLLPIRDKPKSNSIRGVEMATEKQLAWIKQLGYDIEKDVYTKNMVSDILDVLPATKTDIEKMKKYGFDVSGNINRGQASYNIWMYEQKRLVK